MRRRETHPENGSFPIPTKFRGAELNEMDRVADQLGISRYALIRRATLAFVGVIAQCPAPVTSVPQARV
jgi:hypothetical protein